MCFKLKLLGCSRCGFAFFLRVFPEFLKILKQHCENRVVFATSGSLIALFYSKKYPNSQKSKTEQKIWSFCHQ